jgi:hypothetical protein
VQRQRTTSIVGSRRPRVIERLVINSIAMVVAVQGAVGPAWALPSGARHCPAVSSMLTKASRGLLMPSESDYPFSAFSWADAATPRLTIPRLLQLTGHSPDTSVEVVDLHDFFRNVAYPQPWHDPQQAKDVKKYKHLMNVLEAHLTDIHVYRVGMIRIDAYITGRCGIDLDGLSTTLIET